MGVFTVEGCGRGVPHKRCMHPPKHALVCISDGSSTACTLLCTRQLGAHAGALTTASHMTWSPLTTRSGIKASGGRPAAMAGLPPSTMRPAHRARWAVCISWAWVLTKQGFSEVTILGPKRTCPALSKTLHPCQLDSRSHHAFVHRVYYQYPIGMQPHAPLR